MTNELITWPLRAGSGATRIAIRTTVKATRLAAGLAGSAVSLVRPPSGKPPRERSSTPAPPPGHTADPPRAPIPAAQPPTARPQVGVAEPPVVPERPQVDTDTEFVAEPPHLNADTELVAEPPHLDAEPELVAEFAEPGVEDGAGPELKIHEPWDGYGQLDAAAVIDRIASATDAELALVKLYEQSHRQRPTVLEAVEDRLKTVQRPLDRT